MRRSIQCISYNGYAKLTAIQPPSAEPDLEQTVEYPQGKIRESLRRRGERIQIKLPHASKQVHVVSADEPRALEARLGLPAEIQDDDDGCSEVVGEEGLRIRRSSGRLKSQRGQQRRISNTCHGNCKRHSHIRRCRMLQPARGCSIPNRGNFQ